MIVQIPKAFIEERWWTELHMQTMCVVVEVRNALAEAEQMRLANMRHIKYAEGIVGTKAGQSALGNKKPHPD